MKLTKYIPEIKIQPKIKISTLDDLEKFVNKYKNEIFKKIIQIDDDVSLDDLLDNLSNAESVKDDETDEVYLVSEDLSLILSLKPLKDHYNDDNINIIYF
jgi:hypothetical protein